MFNEIHIGPVTFYMYGLMTAVGIISAYLFASHRAKKKHLDEDRILGLVIWCCIFGYLGSKILYLLTILPQLIQDSSLLLSSLRNGWVIYGGILGGIFGGWLYCRRKGLPAWRYFDIGLESVALAQGFGRIGCFFAGCCYGVVTDSSIGIVFRHSEYAPNNVPLFPTQLMSSAFDFLLCLVLVYYDDYKKKRSGEPTALYLILYSVGRFIIEFWRGDVERGSIGVLSTSQFIAIFVAIFGVIIFVKRRRSPEEAAYEAAHEAAAEAEAEAGSGAGVEAETSGEAGAEAATTDGAAAATTGEAEAETIGGAGAEAETSREAGAERSGEAEAEESGEAVTGSADENETSDDETKAADDETKAADDDTQTADQKTETADGEKQ